MDKIKQQRLENAGFKIGNTDEFLNLSTDEILFLDIYIYFYQYIKSLLYFYIKFKHKLND